MFFLGRNFVSGLICTLKSKKNPLKNFLKTKTPKKIYKKPRFFPALPEAASAQGCVISYRIGMKFGKCCSVILLTKWLVWLCKTVWLGHGGELSFKSLTFVLCFMLAGTKSWSPDSAACSPMWSRRLDTMGHFIFP